MYEHQKKYFRTAKGKAAKKRANKKYFASKKGKAASRRARKIRQALIKKLLKQYYENKKKHKELDYNVIGFRF